MFVGAGTGAFNEGDDAQREALRDTPLSAFCVQGTPGCVANTCNDGNACTYDYRDRTGTCVSEPERRGPRLHGGHTGRALRRRSLHAGMTSSVGPRSCAAPTLLAS